MRCDARMTSIGNNIRENRKRLGLTQEELGLKLKRVASKGVIANWENDRQMPNIDKLLDLCDVLGISLIELLELENTEVYVNRIKKGINEYENELNHLDEHDEEYIYISGIITGLKFALEVLKQ